jgi:hypothetical protein
MFSGTVGVGGSRGAVVSLHEYTHPFFVGIAALTTLRSLEVLVW